MMRLNQNMIERLSFSTSYTEVLGACHQTVLFKTADTVTSTSSYCCSVAKSPLALHDPTDSTRGGRYRFLLAGCPGWALGLQQCRTLLATLSALCTRPVRGQLLLLPSVSSFLLLLEPLAPSLQLHHSPSTSAGFPCLHWVTSSVIFVLTKS